MPFGRPPSPPDDSASGLKQELGIFFKDAASYAKLRSELFSIEAREAAEVYGRKFGLTVVAGVMLGMGYLLLLVALIGILGLVLAGAPLTLANWMGGALILSGMHLLPGLILLSKGKKAGSGTPLFEYTRNELQKDQQWLNHQKKH